MPEEAKGKGLYEDPRAALVAVNDYYRTWTRQLTERSFELSLGVIAANWATFGSLEGVLRNPFSKMSIAVVIVGFGVTIVCTWLIAEWLRQQVEHGESDLGRWESEYRANQGKASPWPSTARIDHLARSLRVVKTFVPVLGGLLFVIALFWQQA